MEILDAKLAFAGAAPNAGRQKNIDAIVLHHMAGTGTVENIHIQHRRQGWWGIGYHYYVRKNGEIWRGRPEEFVGSHAGSKNGYNTHSIGICFEGNFETDTMLPDQLNAGRELIEDIKSRYAIKEVIKHSDIAATACPGKNFPFRIMTETSADAKQWAIENGIFRGDGNGNYMWDKPLTREQAAVTLHRLWNLLK